MKKIAYLAICLLCAAMSFGQEPIQDKDNRQAGDTLELTIKDVKYVFRWCPPGKFQMGSPQNEENRQENESQHMVAFSKGFWMLETEVTQGMWGSVMGSNPSNFKGAKRPVDSVSWNDCQEYIKKLNDAITRNDSTIARSDSKGIPEGFKFSLPTESQWEYACRAGTTTAYHFGDTLSREQANVGGGGQTKDVGSYPANAWGLRDMHGNVWEWCLDWYGDYPSGAVTDPTGAVEGSNRVIRGGCWCNDAEDCRSADRSYYDSSFRCYYMGLRLSLVSGE
jgi:formylglycine-generating enzyme required for sulfatase activity